MCQVNVRHALDVAQQVAGCRLCRRLCGHDGKIITLAACISVCQVLNLATVGGNLTNFAVVVGFNAAVSAVNRIGDRILLALFFVYPKVDAFVGVVSVCQLLVKRVAREHANVSLVGVTVHVDSFGDYNAGIGIGRCGFFNFVIVLVVTRPVTVACRGRGLLRLLGRWCLILHVARLFFVAGCHKGQNHAKRQNAYKDLFQLFHRFSSLSKSR